MNLLYEVAQEFLRLLFRDRVHLVKGLRASFFLERTEASIDDRLSKIDTARENLADALRAIDQLREQAEVSKHSLESLNHAVQGASQERDSVATELETLRSLASLDSETVRRALGVPNRGQRWLERLIAFVVGVLASLLATWIWSLIF